MSEPVKYPGFPAGANNLAPDYALPRDDQGNVISARSIVNADVLDNGDLRLRKGFSSLISGTAIYGATSYRGSIHYVDAGSLKRQDGSTTTTLKTGLALRAMSFCEVNGWLYFSNGIDTGIVRGDVVTPWGVEYTETAIGQIDQEFVEPTYRVVTVKVNEYGEEGGCGPGIPASSLSQVSSGNTKVYATEKFGDVFREVISISGSTVDYGKELRTQFLRPMPPGDRIFHYKGRMYAASGNVLWYSDPLFYGLCDVTKNYILFPEDISEAVPVEAGIFVGSDKLYWMPGSGPSDFRLTVALDAKTAARSGTDLPSGGATVLTSRGYALLQESGEVELLDKSISVEPATSGATLFREQDGLSQIVGVGFRPSHQSGMVASDYMDAEIIRRS